MTEKFAFVKTGKLTEQLLEQSFSILSDQDSITVNDQKDNTTAAQKVDFIKKHFEYVPVKVSEESVSGLVDNLTLDVNDFRNKVVFKRGSKYKVRDVVFKEDLNMSLVEAIKDPENNEVSSENEESLPSGRRIDSESDISEGEIERWSDKPKSRNSSTKVKIRKIFNTTGKMDLTAIIPLWQPGGNRLERAKRAKDYVDDVKRFMEASPSTSAPLIIFQSLLRSNMRHIFAELPAAAKSDIDKYTEYILKVYGPNSIERVSVWRMLKQENGESIRSFFYRTINSYFDAKQMTPLVMEDLVKPANINHRNEIVEAFLSGLRSNLVRVQLKARMLSINFKDIPDNAHIIESAFEQDSSSVNWISDAHDKLENKLESSIQKSENQLAKKIANMTAQIETLTANINYIKEGKTTNKYVETRSCLYCRKKGHLIRNCWARKAKEQKDKSKPAENTSKKSS